MNWNTIKSIRIPFNPKMIMAPKVIKSDAEHEAALAYVEKLMDAAPDSDAEAELELWSFLIEKYEEDHFPIGSDSLINKKG